VFYFRYLREGSSKPPIRASMEGPPQQPPTEASRVGRAASSQQPAPVVRRASDDHTAATEAPSRDVCDQQATGEAGGDAAGVDELDELTALLPSTAKADLDQLKPVLEETNKRLNESQNL
jgi:hypothetical protein